MTEAPCIHGHDSKWIVRYQYESGVRRVCRRCHSLQVQRYHLRHPRSKTHQLPHDRPMIIQCDKKQTTQRYDYVAMSEELKSWFRAREGAANKIARILHISQASLDAYIFRKRHLRPWIERQIWAVLELGLLPEYYN